MIFALTMPGSKAPLPDLRQADAPCNVERLMLWRAVIWQAVHDALYVLPDVPAGCLGTEYFRTTMVAAKIKARRWLLGKSYDFYEVCQYAEIDPQAVMKLGIDIEAGRKVSVGNLSFMDSVDNLDPVECDTEPQ